MCAYHEGCGVKTDPTTNLCMFKFLGRTQETCHGLYFVYIPEVILLHVSHISRPLTASIFLLQ